MTTLIDEHEAAKALKVSRGTLANWRSTRLNGPAFVKVGRAVRYRLEDIERFIESQLVQPAGTSPR